MASNREKGNFAEHSKREQANGNVSRKRVNEERPHGAVTVMELHQKKKKDKVMKIESRCVKISFVVQFHSVAVVQEVVLEVKDVGILKC